MDYMDHTVNNERHNPEDWGAGWDLMSQMLSEDEEWARMQFENFHGREY